MGARMTEADAGPWAPLVGRPRSRPGVSLVFHGWFRFRGRVHDPLAAVQEALF
jgi:hypothetical protein